jgi:hypothetical protein
MTPEDTAQGRPVEPKLGFIDPRSIRPFCAGCERPIDPRTITDSIAWKMPDGTMQHVGLCRRCLRSLDHADHAETVRRLQAMRARAFS